MHSTLTALSYYNPATPEELFSSLTHDLSNLKQWLDSNRLSLNVLKTKCLFTGTRYKISLLPSEPYICLDGHLIELIDITDNWYFITDDAILFIDLKKAFDTIGHEILLSKLELYGFKGASMNLFETTSLTELRLQLLKV